MGIKYQYWDSSNPAKNNYLQNILSLCTEHEITMGRDVFSSFIEYILYLKNNAILLNNTTENSDQIKNDFKLIVANAIIVNDFVNSAVLG